MAKELFNAIIVSKVEGCNQPQFVKYRNIPRDRIANLCNYVRKNFPGVSHINIYRKSNKEFVKQLKRDEILFCMVGQL
jgi:hypothetical protein